MSSRVIFSLTEAQAHAVRCLDWGEQPGELNRDALRALISKGFVTGAAGALSLTALGRQVARLAALLERASPPADTQTMPLPGIEPRAHGAGASPLENASPQ